MRLTREELKRLIEEAVYRELEAFNKKPRGSRIYRVTRDCNECKGSGKKYINSTMHAPGSIWPCGKCKGTGRGQEIIEVEEMADIEEILSKM